jgi:hypothetical protein
MIDGIPNPKHYLWQRWAALRNVCTNPNNVHYPCYGGRGITYNSSWDDFPTFVEDIESTLGLPPYKSAHLDRIDNDGNYELSNLRWSSPQENYNNRRTNALLTAFGKTQTLADWAREVNLPARTIWSRINDRGYDVERALTAEKNSGNRKKVK